MSDRKDNTECTQPDSAKTQQLVPKLSPPDEDGFQSFSLRNRDGDEVMRLSVNFERTENYLRKIDSEYLETISSTGHWKATVDGEREGKPNDEEHERLMRAATLVAAQDGPFKGKEDQARIFLLELARQGLRRDDIKEGFVLVAAEALKVASTALSKHTLNVTLHHYGPSRYSSSMRATLLSRLSKMLDLFLGIRRGQDSAFSASHYKSLLNDAKARLVRAGLKEVTQGAVAEVLNETLPDQTIDERMIRRWNEEHDINWQEFKKVGSS